MTRSNIFIPRLIPCHDRTCRKRFSTTAGATKHFRIKHAHFAPITPPPQQLRASPGARTPTPEQDFSLSDPLLPFDPPPSPPPSPGLNPGQPEGLGAHKANQELVQYHPLLNSLLCDAKGHFLPEGAPRPPPPLHDPLPTDWTPYNEQHQFELADLLFRHTEMAANPLNDLMQIWAARHSEQGPPFASKQHLHDIIDSTEIGGVPWQSFACSFSGNVEEADIEAAPWKLKEYDIWFHNPLAVIRSQLGNPDFIGEIDIAAKRVYDSHGKRRYCDLMSGKWANCRSDQISQDTTLHGSSFCPIIMGSDKTTVSVATGHTEYYPLYISNGMIHNNVRRARRNGLTLAAFLAIPKADATHKNSDKFRKFRRNIFHASLSYIFEAMRPFMTEPDIVRFGDGYFRRVIYGLGPYIADYPEQALLACIVQGWCARCTARFNDLDGPGGHRTHILTEALFQGLGKKVLWDGYGIISDILLFTHHFPGADIHELIAPDLLHQLIKGTFKDHLVTWVNEYLKLTYPPNDAAKIIADIDHRIAAVPPFPGLWRFPEGRGFKQWTGDDSKALMKVYLPAISGHVPPRMVEALQHFLEFGYLVRRSVINEDDLVAIDNAVTMFHQARVVFQELGIRPEGFSLPRQHSMTHYRTLIQEFGAPNGLCSSITESAHICAVKKPWRRSSRYNALRQMLLINQCLDKLAASCMDFERRGMLASSLFKAEAQVVAQNSNEDVDGGAVDRRDVLGGVTLAKKPGV